MSLKIERSSALRSTDEGLLPKSGSNNLSENVVKPRQLFAGAQLATCTPLRPRHAYFYRSFNVMCLGPNLRGYRSSGGYVPLECVNGSPPITCYGWRVFNVALSKALEPESRSVGPAMCEIDSLGSILT